MLQHFVSLLLGWLVEKYTQKHHRKRSHSLIHPVTLRPTLHSQFLLITPRIAHNADCAVPVHTVIYVQTERDHQFHAHTHFIDAIIACRPRTANSHLVCTHIRRFGYGFLHHHRGQICWGPDGDQWWRYTPVHCAGTRFFFLACLTMTDKRGFRPGRTLFAAYYGCSCCIWWDEMNTSAFGAIITAQTHLHSPPKWE